DGSLDLDGLVCWGGDVREGEERVSEVVEFPDDVCAVVATGESCRDADEHASGHLLGGEERRESWFVAGAVIDERALVQPSCGDGLGDAGDLCAEGVDEVHHGGLAQER